jgi:ribosome biogenesis protein NSA1
LNKLNEKKEPIFRAKNVPDNWMQLREAIWIMDINFLDASRIVTSTAYHQVIKINLYVTY